MNELTLITFVSVISPIFLATYVFFRLRMVRSTNKNMDVNFYTRFRVLKSTLVLLAVLFVSFTFVYFIAYFILARNGVLPILNQEFFIIVCIVFVSFAASFGGGIYISSILTEQYTLEKLKKYKEYSILNIQVQLYHGPVSHLFIYSGAVYILLLISILEFTNPVYNIESFQFLLYGINGLLFGIIFYIGQIFNSTWKHQLFFINWAFVIYIILLLSGLVDFSTMPFNFFFYCFLITIYISLVLTYIYHKKYKTHYRYSSGVNIPKRLIDELSKISNENK